MPFSFGTQKTFMSLILTLCGQRGTSCEMLLSKEACDVFLETAFSLQVNNGFMKQNVTGKVLTLSSLQSLVDGGSYSCKAGNAYGVSDISFPGDVMVEGKFTDLCCVSSFENCHLWTFDWSNFRGCRVLVSNSRNEQHCFCLSVSVSKEKSAKHHCSLQQLFSVSQPRWSLRITNQRARRLCCTMTESSRFHVPHPGVTSKKYGGTKTTSWWTKTTLN